MNTKKKGRALLMVVAGTLVGATSGCPRGFELPDGGGTCFWGNAASVCFFADGGVCEDFSSPPPADAGTDGGTDGGENAGP